MEANTLSTAGLNERQRVSFWIDLVCDTFVELDCEIPFPDDFHGRLVRREAGDLHFSHVVSARHVVTRTRAQIAQSSQDDFLLSLQLAGRSVVSQDGREARLERGDFALYDTTRPYDLRFDGEFSQLVLRLPREAMYGRIAEVEPATARTIAGHCGMGRLAASFLRQIHDQLDELDPIGLARVQASAIDLVAAAVAEQAGSPVGTSEHHVLLRRRVGAYIDRHLADPRLDCTAVAAAHGLSARQLRKAFEDTPTSVSTLIWTRRLEQARRNLADPLQSHLSVTSVGYDVGFKEAAHFSRAFKAAYGHSPSAFRARMLA